MLAIFAYDRPDGTTLVAIDGKEGLTDLYIRGTAGGGVQLATNSEFGAPPTIDTKDWSNSSNLNLNNYFTAGSRPLYITNATPNLVEKTEIAARGFDAQDTSAITDFVLSNGNIDIRIAGAVKGRLVDRVNKNSWTFENDNKGRLSFTAAAGNDPSKPQPIDLLSVVREGSTNPDNRGAGQRGVIAIQWTDEVSTYVGTCPELAVSYTYDGEVLVGTDNVTNTYLPGVAASERSLEVSSQPKVAFDMPSVLAKDGFGGQTLRDAAGDILRVSGTTNKSGTITVHDVLSTGSEASVRDTLTFSFSNDASGRLVFTPLENDWLAIAPGSTLENLKFVNRYAGRDGKPAAGEVPVLPGRVTINDYKETWFEYTLEFSPTDVTVWAGFDVKNAIEIDLTKASGSFNVLSPIVDAPAISVMGAEAVNFEAPVSVTGNLRLGSGGFGDLPSVKVAVFNAASAASGYNFAIKDGSLTVSPSGSLSGALPINGVLGTASGIVSASMVNADLLVEGTVFATSQQYDLTLRGGYSSPNLFTTRSQSTGLDSGLVRGQTVVVNMAASGGVAVDDDVSYHDVDLRTQVDTFRTRAAGGVGSYPANGIYPYNLSIRETDAVTFDAVAGSSRPILLSAEGGITMAASLNTLSDVKIDALAGAGVTNAFTVTAPIVTKFGVIEISADSLQVSNSLKVTDARVEEGKTDITIVARKGDIIVKNLISAVNNVSLVQQANGSNAGQVQADGVRARALLVEAAGDVKLRTTVETLSGVSGGGFTVRETDDLEITSLRAGGRVALEAAGVDRGVPARNPIALKAVVTDATALEVSTPNGSADVLVNTPKPMTLGGNAAPAIANMLAAGDVKIRSTAGDILVNDAPLAGGNARIVKAASTFAVPAVYVAGVPGVNAGTLTGTGSINALNGGKGLFDSQQLQVGDRVLVRLGSRNGVTTQDSNGVYVVARVGGGATGWQLTRATNSDTAAELGSGSYVRVAAGARLAGKVYQVTYSSAILGASAISVQEFTPKTEIGSDSRSKAVTFNVSSAGGTNSSAGSLGKMLLLRQQNDTSRSPLNPDQIMRFTMGSIPGTIRLTQELPTISKAFDMVGNAAIDGSRITMSRNGLPVSGTTTVNGFEFVVGSGATTVGGNPRTGASLSGVTVGGFTKGAAVKIDGVSGIRVSNVVLGRSGTGDRLANQFGVLATGNSVTSGTVVGSKIYSSTGVGFAVANGASGMKLVGSTVGATSLNNQIGIRLNSAVGGSQIGVEPVGPTAALPQALVTLGGGSSTFMLPTTYTAIGSLKALVTDQGRLGVRGAGVPDGAFVTAVNEATRVVTLSMPATASGPATVTFGNFVATAVGATTLVLPQGVPMDRLYLGQKVTGAGIPSTAQITAIDVTTRKITLSAAMTATDTTAVMFGVGGRNDVTGNLTGMVLAAGANTVINTNVYANTFDGITISGGTQKIGTGKKTSATSNAIYANGGFGIRQVAPAVVAQQQIWGNYIDMAVNGRTTQPNVRGGISPKRAVNPATQLDADGNQYGPVAVSGGSGGGGSGGSGTGSGATTVRPRV